MRVTNWDAVNAAAPLDAQASIVRDGSGDLWEAKIPAHHSHWDAPPLPEAPFHGLDEDLTGRAFGRMTTVRYHGPGSGGGRWLVRCACGAYELRRARVIRSMTDPEHCCFACERVKILRKRSARKLTAAARKSEAAALDRLAHPTHCGVCKSPAACFAVRRCVAFQPEDAA